MASCSAMADHDLEDIPQDKSDAQLIDEEDFMFWIYDYVLPLTDDGSGNGIKSVTIDISWFDLYERWGDWFLAIDWDNHAYVRNLTITADLQAPSSCPGEPLCWGHGRCWIGAGTSVCACDKGWHGEDCGIAARRVLVNDGNSVLVGLPGSDTDIYTEKVIWAGSSEYLQNSSDVGDVFGEDESEIGESTLMRGDGSAQDDSDAASDHQADETLEENIKAVAFPPVNQEWWKPLIREGAVDLTDGIRPSSANVSKIISASKTAEAIWVMAAARNTTSARACTDAMSSLWNTTWICQEGDHRTECRNEMNKVTTETMFVCDQNFMLASQIQELLMQNLNLSNQLQMMSFLNQQLVEQLKQIANEKIGRHGVSPSDIIGIGGGNDDIAAELMGEGGKVIWNISKPIQSLSKPEVAANDTEMPIEETISDSQTVEIASETHARKNVSETKATPDSDGNIGEGSRQSSPEELMNASGNAVVKDERKSGPGIAVVLLSTGMLLLMVLLIATVVLLRRLRDRRYDSLPRRPTLLGNYTPQISPRNNL